MINWLKDKPVVLPLDFTPDSLKALKTALEIVEGDAKRVHVLHILPELSPLEPGVVSGDITAESRTMHVKKEILKRFGDDAEYKDVEIKVLIGSVPKKTVSYAKEIGAGLIVLAEHHHSEAHRLLVGSRAERIVHLATCPVLVVKGN